MAKAEELEPKLLKIRAEHAIEELLLASPAGSTDLPKEDCDLDCTTSSVEEAGVVKPNWKVTGTSESIQEEATKTKDVLSSSPETGVTWKEPLDGH